MRGPSQASRYFNVLSLFWGLLAATPAGATSFLERPFPDSVQDAPVIVHGTVGPTMTDWGHERDGGRRIFTYWEVEVVEVLKGSAESAGSILRMREMGGEKDGTGMQVSGAATFSTGEDVVVFLDDKNSEGSYDVFGMMMGKYVLKKDADGQSILSGAGINSLSRPRIYDADDAPGNQAKDAPTVQKWTLEALRRLIASQSNLPGKSVVSPRPSAVPGKNAVAAARMTSVPSPVSTAPQLQTSPPEAQSFPLAMVLAIGAAMLGILWFLFSKTQGG